MEPGVTAGGERAREPAIPRSVDIPGYHAPAAEELVVRVTGVAGRNPSIDGSKYINPNPTLSPALSPSRITSLTLPVTLFLTLTLTRTLTLTLGCDGLFVEEPEERNGFPCFTRVGGHGALYFVLLEVGGV